MVIGERRRRELHQRLVDVLGVQEADALMEHLPPTGWAEVATRSDLDHAVQLLSGDIAVLRAEMKTDLAQLAVTLTDKVAAQTRTVVISMATMVVAVIGSMTAVTLAH